MGGGKQTVTRAEAVGLIVAHHMEAMIASLAQIQVTADMVVAVAPEDAKGDSMCIVANLQSDEASVKDLLERAYADVLSRPPDIDIATMMRGAGL